MSTISVSITEAAFAVHINPYLSKAKRGYVSRIPLHKIFNYMLYWLVHRLSLASVTDSA